MWQNENTVVIGRNQNVESECPVKLLEQDGVCIARRNSGGGAVYHDLGNLNYSFIAHKKLYDVPKQMEVILTALRDLGFDAETAGRNNILVQGKKVSGNAFFESRDICCHHGTLMVDVNMDAVNKYLQPKTDKLTYKGIPSVRSRVANLQEFQPMQGMARLKQAILLSFERIFGGQCSVLPPSEIDLAEIEKKRERFAGPRWIYGKSRQYEHVLSHRFAWGGLTLGLCLNQGSISDVWVDTDAMDPELPNTLKEKLLGVPFKNDALCKAVLHPGVCAEIAEWLAKESLGG